MAMGEARRSSVEAPSGRRQEKGDQQGGLPVEYGQGSQNQQPRVASRQDHQGGEEVEDQARVEIEAEIRLIGGEGHGPGEQTEPGQDRAAPIAQPADEAPGQEEDRQVLKASESEHGRHGIPAQSQSANGVEEALHEPGGQESILPGVEGLPSEHGHVSLDLHRARVEEPEILKIDRGHREKSREAHDHWRKSVEAGGGPGHGGELHGGGRLDLSRNC